MRWLVCLDGSPGGTAAFNTALHLMCKEKDELFLMSIAKETEPVYGSFGVDPSVYRINEELEGRAKKILIHYGRRAVDAGCKHVTRILGKAHHPKALICEAAEKRGIDYILIGRRGLSAFDRFVAGSVSKYVMENADCNVIICKGDYSEEVHSNKKSCRTGGGARTCASRTR
mmetsp:Transcript_10951/g.27681  ORF Transcript_10951/g.27681 Transcript_10951/m.27681 type:complete len:172 (-) Transcript_10951:277-792(-)